MERLPHLKVDIIIEKGGKIALIKRLNGPFKGMTAIPGGSVEYNETVEGAAAREALEETSLEIKLKAILGVYSDPKRDPRHHGVSVVFVAEPARGELKGSSDAKEAFWTKPEEIDTARMAFDHGRVIEDYLKWKRKGGTFWSGK